MNSEVRRDWSPWKTSWRKSWKKSKMSTTSGRNRVQWIRKISKKDYIVSARIEVDKLEEELGIQLPKGKYATWPDICSKSRVRYRPRERHQIKGNHLHR